MIALLRTEWTKAFRRTRSLAIAGLLIGLPLLIVWAINRRGDQGERGDHFGLFFLARQSGLLVPAAVLGGVVSGFLLVVIAGMFAGDSVAGDAGWGNLRYVLMRPVPRGRLLVAKAIVAATFIWLTTALVALVALIGGIIAFGVHPVVTPFLGGGAAAFTPITLTTHTLVVRTVIATAYIAASYTALLGLGVFYSTLTDSAAGAIGATIGTYIVSEILDAIPQLGSIRYGFPTHYLSAWEPMFTENRYSHDMLAGLGVQLAYLVVFGTAAIVWFRRKDIRS